MQMTGKFLFVTDRKKGIKISHNGKFNLIITCLLFIIEIFLDIFIRIRFEYNSQSLDFYFVSRVNKLRLTTYR